MVISNPPYIGTFTISTDIIVGYPTETQKNFEETIGLLKETRPDIVNLSRYSLGDQGIAALIIVFAVIITYRKLLK